MAQSPKSLNMFFTQDMHCRGLMIQIARELTSALTGNSHQNESQLSAQLPVVYQQYMFYVFFEN